MIIDIPRVIIYAEGQLFSCMSRRIRERYRIIITIGKHIIAQDALTGGSIRVCIDESAQFRIIITGLEIVERGLSIE